MYESSFFWWIVFGSFLGTILGHAMVMVLFFMVGSDDDSCCGCCGTFRDCCRTVCCWPCLCSGCCKKKPNRRCRHSRYQRHPQCPTPSSSDSEPENTPPIPPPIPPPSATTTTTTAPTTIITTSSTSPLPLQSSSISSPSPAISPSNDTTSPTATKKKDNLENDDSRPLEECILIHRQTPTQPHTL